MRDHRRQQDTTAAERVPPDAPETTASAPVVWRALLGHHAPYLQVRRGEITSPILRLDFADVAVPNKAFKRVVREVEFDVAELALMTFLMARSRGVPLRLLPIVLFSRNPLPYLVCRAGDRFSPRDLEGRRVGVRAYTTTTAVWVRALLADQFGVASDRVTWITYEEGHVAGVVEPPNVHRDAAHADLVAMLLDGVVDAVIVDPVPADTRIVPVVPNALDVYRTWQASTGAECVNHVMVVTDERARDGERLRELFRLFRESHARAAGEAPRPAIGLSALTRSLQVAIAAAARDGLLAQPLTVDDLVTGELASLT
jgi:4,5-dihydroxyphthalate decarboxylase